VNKPTETGAVFSQVPRTWRRRTERKSLLRRRRGELSSRRSLFASLDSLGAFAFCRGNDQVSDLAVDLLQDLSVRGNRRVAGNSRLRRTVDQETLEVFDLLVVHGGLILGEKVLELLNKLDKLVVGNFALAAARKPRLGLIPRGENVLDRHVLITILGEVGKLVSNLRSEETSSHHEKQRLLGSVEQPVAAKLIVELEPGTAIGVLLVGLENPICTLELQDLFTLSADEFDRRLMALALGIGQPFRQGRLKLDRDGTGNLSRITRLNLIGVAHVLGNNHASLGVELVPVKLTGVTNLENRLLHSIESAVTLVKEQHHGLLARLQKPLAGHEGGTLVRETGHSEHVTLRHLRKPAHLKRQTRLCGKLRDCLRLTDCVSATDANNDLRGDREQQLLERLHRNLNALIGHFLPSILSLFVSDRLSVPG
jgi:hypothetical protein